jgi:hypothetical protein
MPNPPQRTPSARQRWVNALLFYLGKGPAQPTANTASPMQTATAWRVIRLMQLAYALFLVMVFVTLRAGVTPDLIVLLLVMGFVLPGQRVRFIRDFVPLVLLVFSYDALRGYADDLGGAVSVHGLIQAERLLFGGFFRLPTWSLVSSAGTTS